MDRLLQSSKVCSGLRLGLFNFYVPVWWEVDWGKNQKFCQARLSELLFADGGAVAVGTSKRSMEMAASVEECYIRMGPGASVVNTKN